MEFQKSKSLLDKINALYKNISSDPRNVSSIERDLMRSYIQQFYESFLEMPTVAAAVTPQYAPPEESKAAAPRITLRKPETASPPPPPLRPQPEPPKPEPMKVEPAPAPMPPPPPPPAEVVVERVAPPPPAAVVIEKAPPPPPVQVEEPTPPPAPAPRPSTTIDPDLEELFAFKSATELSEKLSELPITDIKKAMGINEMISTQKELFGGDAAAFDATVSTLNQLRNYDEAKDYLVRNVATKYNWTAKERKEKAKSFAKLVRRRY